MVKVQVDVVGLTEQERKFAGLAQLEFKAMQDAFGQATLAIAGEANQAAAAAASENQGAMASAILEGDLEASAPASGKVRGIATPTVRGSTINTLTGRVGGGSRGGYMALIELGRRPGRYPPAKNLAGWVEANMGVSDPKEVKAAARRLSKAIGQGGIRPTPVLDEAFDKAEGKLTAAFTEAADEITRGLQNGR